MNRKQFGVLIILLVALGGAGWFVKKSHDRTSGAGEAGTGQKLLGEAFPINDVAQIAITRNTNELHLEKKGDLWRVKERNNYPANFSQISEFLIKVRDLKVIQNEPVGATQLPRLQLAPSGQGTNSGIVVDLKNPDGKSFKNFVLGKKHLPKKKQPSEFQFGDSSADGRYVMLSDKPNNALLIGDALNEIEPSPEAWLNKDFFKVERPKAISATFSTSTNSWRIFRDLESGDWKLADAKPGEVLDDARVSGVSSPFASPSFTDAFSLNNPPANSGLGKPTTITVQTFDDFTYTIKIGTKSGEDYPLTMSVIANFPKDRIPAKDEKPEDKDKADKAWKTRQADLEAKLKQTKQFEDWVYLVPAWAVDPILKDRKDLLQEKKAEPKLEPAKK